MKMPVVKFDKSPNTDISSTSIVGSIFDILFDAAWDLYQLDSRGSCTTSSVYATKNKLHEIGGDNPKVTIPIQT